MEPVDAVKLVYQSAFGCGHLLSETCAQRVEEELAHVAACGDVPALTPIGGGLGRLSLAAPAVRELPPERIADMMRVTMAQPLGGEAAMAAGTGSPAGAGPRRRGAVLPGKPGGLSRRLGRTHAREPQRRVPGRLRAGLRVVREDLGTLVPVVIRIERLLAETGRALVVLTGPCGSGKSTLADALAALYHTQPIRMDDFFLPPPLRTAERLRQPGGNVHYERFRDEMLAGLMRGGDVAYRRYDCRSGAWVDRLHRAAPVAVIEGSYSHHPAFAQAYAALGALRVYVYTAEKSGSNACACGRGESGFLPFKPAWIPLEKSYIEAYDIKSGADIALESQPWA